MKSKYGAGFRTSKNIFLKIKAFFIKMQYPKEDRKRLMILFIKRGD